MVYGLSHAVFIGGRRRLPPSKDPKADPYGYHYNQNHSEHRLQRTTAPCFDFGDRHTLPHHYSTPAQPTPVRNTRYTCLIT
jgi:hypothetical protein